MHALFCMEPLHSNSSVFFLLLLPGLSLFLELFSVVNCKALEQCLQQESSALLQLKRGFFSPELHTWQPGTDCCFWVGVTCDESRRVIGLDLSDRSIAGTIDPILFNLTCLETLNLSYNVFYNQSIPDSGWERLANLSSLRLSSSGFTGMVPAGISRLTKLSILDLSSYNENLSFTANPNFLQNMSNLRELYLDYVDVSAYGGEWCGALANYTPALAVLSMSGCSLFGYFPNKIFLQRDLKHLDVSMNMMLSGSLPDFPVESNLETLALSETNFSGNLPDTMGNLKLLTSLVLNGCQFSGRIPLSMGNLSQLKRLILSNNSFCGPIPFLPQFSMDFEPSHKYCLNGKPCTLEYQHEIPHLDLSNNKLTGEIPTFICNWIYLEVLDLSNNKLNGSIPPCLLERNSLDFLSNLKYANNNRTGEIPTFIYNLTSLGTFDLSNNMLNGSIQPHLLERSSLKFLSYLDLSKNKLTGEIPTFFCSLNKLKMLDLSDNKLTGSIPSCLFKEGCGLLILNLRGNQLHGAIPHEVTPNCKLQTINLRDNQLEGLLPRFLSNCRSLELLDLGNNNLKDVFPYWLGNISTLRVLILRSNKFYGLVGLLEGNQKTNYTFSTLNVLDISSNNFSGNLCAKFFSNFKSMMINTTDVIQPSIDTLFGFYYSLVVLTIMNKGQLMTVQKFWRIIKSIDISNNYFEGEIPTSIGQLVSLQVLNLSHNHLVGKILPQLGNLLRLESLDLSMNSLSGKIPQELISLHFLSALNLSYNMLVGEIPSGGQFSTFPNSFEGNKGLCWHPCKPSVPIVNHKVPSTPTLGGTTSENRSYKIVLGLLFGVGFGVSMAAVIVADVMCCDRRRRKIIRSTRG